MGNALSIKEIRDICEWDAVNWGKAVRFIDRLDLPINGKRVLEVGANNGGMSLFFANRGAEVVCSDINNIATKAREKHAKWHVEDRIEYESFDATELGHIYNNAFDIITFKSVLGGIGYGGAVEKEKSFIAGIEKALKENGYVIFIENMKGTKMHEGLRRKFSKCGSIWDYQTDKSIGNLMKNFTLVDKGYYGVLGLFGPKEAIRRLLGVVDYFLEIFVPAKNRYVGVFVYRK